MTYSRRRFLVLSAAGAAAPFVFWPGRAPTVTNWSSAPRLPWAAQEIYSTIWDEQILMAGGLRSPADSDRRFTTLSGTALFHPAEEAWTRGPSLPAPRHHIVLASAGQRAYGFGGFVGESLRNGFQFQDDVYAFDGEQWARIGALPSPLGETVALSVGGRIHLVTGSLRGDERQGDTGMHIVYDPSADSWTEARPAPTARSSATGAVIDGALYVAGGRVRRNGITNLGALERYAPEDDTWSELRPLPQPSGGLAGAALNGTLYVFGGEYFGGGGGVYEHTWAYDPQSDDWTERPPMRTPRHGLAAAALDARVFAIGGNTAAGVGAATSSVVEAFSPHAG